MKSLPYLSVVEVILKTETTLCLSLSTILQPLKVSALTNTLYDQTKLNNKYRFNTFNQMRMTNQNTGYHLFLLSCFQDRQYKMSTAAIRQFKLKPST